MSLIECIGRIVAEPRLIAEAHVMPAETHPPEQDRRPLAQTLRERIARHVTAD